MRGHPRSEKARGFFTDRTEPMGICQPSWRLPIIYTENSSAKCSLISRLSFLDSTGLVPYKYLLTHFMSFIHYDPIKICFQHGLHAVLIVFIYPLFWPALSFIQGLQCISRNNDLIVLCPEIEFLIGINIGKGARHDSNHLRIIEMKNFIEMLF